MPYLRYEPTYIDLLDLTMVQCADCLKILYAPGHTNPIDTHICDPEWAPEWQRKDTT